MSGFRNLRELTDAQDAGQYLYASWRKQPTQATGAGVWFDLSMSPGNPAPNYYIGSPNVFTPLKQSTDGGLRHGGNVNALGKKKFLRKLMAQTVTATAAPLSCILMDYVGFYPFIDESVLNEQLMDNTVPIPRYVNNAVAPTLGPELLINGNFSAGTANWVPGNGASLTASDGVLTVTSAGVSYGSAAQGITVVPGETYIIECTAAIGTANAGWIQVTAGAGIQNNSFVTYLTSARTLTVKALSTVMTVGVQANNNVAGSTVTCSGFSVKRLIASTASPSFQLMPVVVAGQTGFQSFVVKYTNQDGIPNRVTVAVNMTTQFVNGTVLHSVQAGAGNPDNGPFLPLQRGDTGVRSVESVTIGGVGDVGLFSLVLVKPLSTFSLFGIDAPTEVDYWQDMASMPEILDDAYLNLVALPNGSLSGAPINGILETTFN